MALCQQQPVAAPPPGLGSPDWGGGAVRIPKKGDATGSPGPDRCAVSLGNDAPCGTKGFHVSGQFRACGGHSVASRSLLATATSLESNPNSHGHAGIQRNSDADGRGNTYRNASTHIDPDRHADTHSDPDRSADAHADDRGVSIAIGMGSVGAHLRTAAFQPRFFGCGFLARFWVAETGGNLPAAADARWSNCGPVSGELTRPLNAKTTGAEVGGSPKHQPSSTVADLRVSQQGIGKGSATCGGARFLPRSLGRFRLVQVGPISHSSKMPRHGSPVFSVGR
jgi:hypothetical protein